MQVVRTQIAHIISVYRVHIARISSRIRPKRTAIYAVKALIFGTQR